jgi:hypothetical protein
VSVPVAPANRPVPPVMIASSLTLPMFGGVNFKAALLANAATIVLAHNHPSGDATAPAASDVFDGNVGALTTLSPAAASGTYFVRVHAVGASGERGPSNEGRLQLGGSTGCEPPAAPAQLTTNAVGSTVTSTWGAAATASSYVIEAGSIPGSVNLCLVRQGHAVREP